MPQGCPSPRRPAEREADGKDHIVVTNQARQRIDGWGASVVTDTRVDPLANPEGLTRRQLDVLDRRIFEEAGINLIRVFGPGYGYFEALAARPAWTDDPRLRFMQRVAPYGVRFMFTGAEAPAELKDGKTLANGREDDYARYIAGYLRFARDVMGVGFAYAAVANEPDNRDSRLVLTPPQAARVYGALRQEISRQGPPPNSSWVTRPAGAPPAHTPAGSSVMAGLRRPPPRSQATRTTAIAWRPARLRS